MVFLVVQYDTCWQQCVLTVFAMSVVWFLQVSLWRQAQRNGLHLCPYAQELAADAGDGNTGCVEQPPGEGMWEGAVVHPAGEQVEEMYCAREVQALLCPLHKVPEAHRPARRWDKEIFCMCHKKEFNIRGPCFKHALQLYSQSDNCVRYRRQ